MVSKSPRPEEPPTTSLKYLDPSVQHVFISPSKKINEGEDVSFFLTSKAYKKIMTFLLQLNGAMYPRQSRGEGSKPTIHTWELGSPAVEFSRTVISLRKLVARLNAVIDEAPPETGPRRFGNMSFRKWYEIVESRIGEYLTEFLPAQVLLFGHGSGRDIAAKDELGTYLLGSFGSAQRLDYGSGHELSFLAFLGAIWMLGGFEKAEPGVEERGIVLGVIEPYLQLIRRLIKVYNLEPAGSHGVWGLDDHSFIPYIFGSAQFAPAISSLEQIPAEGSLPDAPDPAGVAKVNIVEAERNRNMYFGAVGFIYDVKKGPFWEHSPILYDISGVRAGWAKINKGMIKMYNAEVLSKFPVVQHFPFGSLFPWERDPSAESPVTSIHTSSQPSKTSFNAGGMGKPSTRGHPQEGTKAPWASNIAAPPPASLGTAAPWARPSESLRAAPSAGQLPITRAPWGDPQPIAPFVEASSTRSPTTRNINSNLPPRLPNPLKAAESESQTKQN
ncbi:MAG: Serine/threonine-protein phosphatase 2A activator 1 [Candelina submexicana]|nr:MAG: Serine/threonine-protein phosphatase 2A activator 1 [Candelina submexicana]